MALNLGELFIRVSVDARKVSPAKVEVEKLAKSAKKAEVETKKLSNAALGLKSALGGLITLQLAKEVIMFTDHMRGLELQIKDMTRTSGDFKEVKDQLIGITMVTGAALDSNVALAQNVGRAARDMGKSNAEVLQFIENTNKAAIIGGAGATEIKFAMRQLGQAMASTNVRAEEFNSILENTPGLASEIARGMGMTVTQMRVMMLEGKLSSEAVFDAINKQTASLNEKFSEMPVRVGQAVEKMKAAWGTFLLELHKTAPVMDMIGEGASNLAWAMTHLLKGQDTLTESIQKSNAAGDTTVMQAKRYLEYQQATKKTYTEKLGLLTKEGEVSHRHTVAYKTQLQNWRLINQTIKGIRPETKRMAEIQIEVEGLMKDTSDEAKLLLQTRRDEYKILQQSLDSQQKFKQSQIDSAALADQEKSLMENQGKLLLNKYMKKQNTLQLEKEMVQKILEAKSITEEERKIFEEVNRLIDVQISKVAERNRQAALNPEIENAKKFQQFMAQFDTGAQGAVRKHQENQTKLLTMTKAGSKERAQAILANDKWLQEEQAKLNKKTSPVGGIEKEFKQVQDDLMSPADKERLRYEEQKLAIAEGEQLKLDSIKSYQEMRVQAEVEHNKKMSDIREADMAEKHQAFADEMKIHSMKASLIEGFMGNVNEVLKRAGMEGTAIQKAALLAQQAMAVTQMIINAHVAASEAKKLDPFGGLAAMTLAIGYANAGMVAGMAIGDAVGGGSGKATGGDVSPNMMYPVNELGTELLTMGGKDFLMTGNNSGSITPADQLGGGVNIVINNNAPGVDVSHREGANGQQIVDIAVARSKSEMNSELYDQVDKNYGLGRKIQEKFKLNTA